MKTTTRRKALLAFFSGLAASDISADPMVFPPMAGGRPGFLRANWLRKATLAVEVYYRDPKNLSEDQKQMAESYALFMMGFLLGIRASAYILLRRLDDEEDDILIPPKPWLLAKNSAPSLGKFLQERKEEIPDDAGVLLVLTIWYLRCHPKAKLPEESLATVLTKELLKKERVD